MDHKFYINKDITFSYLNRNKNRNVEPHMIENDLEKYWTLKVNKNYMNSLVRLRVLVGSFGPGSGLTRSDIRTA